MNRDEIRPALESGADVRLFYATDRAGTHAKGRIVGYYDAPTVVIVGEDGRQVAWLASLTELDAPLSPGPEPANDSEE